MPTQVAIVTGGSGGIGRAIAEALAADGCDVAITGRDQERLAECQAAIESRGVRALSLAADLRDPATAQALLRLVEGELGAPTVLVNNAGTAPTAKFDATDDAMLDEVLDLHVRVPFRLIRAVLAPMRASGGPGCIVQLASSAGLRGFAFTSAYTAAKHAMVGMTRTLALELAKTPLRAYAVCPGFVDTDITRRSAESIAARGKQTAEQAMDAMGAMNKIGRMHSAAEVAEVVTRLCRELPDGCVYDLDRDPPGFLPDQP